MNKLIVFNHKMSLLYDDLYNYIDRINNIDIDDDIIICPSSIYLESFLNNSDYETYKGLLTDFQNNNYESQKDLEDLLKNIQSYWTEEVLKDESST